MSSVERMVRIPERTIAWDFDEVNRKLDLVRDLTLEELQLTHVYPDYIAEQIPIDFVESKDMEHDIGLWFGVDQNDDGGPACFATFTSKKGGETLNIRVAITNKYISEYGEKLKLPGSSHERFVGAFIHMVSGEGSQQTREVLCELLQNLSAYEWDIANHQV